VSYFTLRFVLIQLPSFTPKLISDRRFFDAVDIMLGMQNHDNGFASYETIRGPGWLEWLNPAEVFGMPAPSQEKCLAQTHTGDIMIEHSYPECTTSVITALTTFRQYYPDYRSIEVESVSSHLSLMLVNLRSAANAYSGL
jgi:lanosterol synthase